MAPRVADRRRQDLEHALSKYEKGDYIKVEFHDATTGVAEWMWVRIHRCDDEKQVVFGILNNAPVNDTSGKLKLSTELVISFTQIRVHKKA
jgi:uncharacterized protein YegJ (DUF2314 family)